MTTNMNFEIKGDAEHDAKVVKLVEDKIKFLTSQLKEKEKIVVLMLDEMGVTPHLKFDAKHDAIVGIDKFNSNPEEISYTTNAMVLMVSHKI